MHKFRETLDYYQLEDLGYLEANSCGIMEGKEKLGFEKGWIDL